MPLPVCVCAIYSTHILIDCKRRAQTALFSHVGSERNSSVTHADVAFMAFGRYGAHVMIAAIFMAQIGFSSAYLLFLSQNLASVVKGYSHFTSKDHLKIY